MLSNVPCQVYEHTKTSLVCETVPEHSVPALPFDAVVYDLVRLLVRRKDVSVECLTSEENRISEHQVGSGSNHAHPPTNTHSITFPSFARRMQSELLLEKLHADETDANWDDVGTAAVAHLLRRYLETLPVAVVPSGLFRSMLYASESNMSAWLLSDMEMKSMETGKTIQDWDQHRVALKSMVGLIFAITKRSMAGTIEEIRARAADVDLPSEDLLKVLSDFSRLSRQAASFFASGLLRPAIEDDIIRQKPWGSKVEQPPEEGSSLGFRTCPKRPKPRSKLTETEAVSAFVSNKEYLEVVDRIMKLRENIRTLARLPSKQRNPLVEVWRTG